MGEDAGQTARFEDRRWLQRPQEPMWRHQVAVRLVRAEPVLDIGGGDGLLLRMLDAAGFTGLALADLSPVAVEKVRAAGFEATVADVTRGELPYEDATFGTVCALDVLEHLYDPLAAVREMARVGRELVIVVPNFHHWRARLQMLVGITPFQSRPERGHVHWFNPAALSGVLGDAGLVVDTQLLQATGRLGPLGPALATLRPSLFAGSIAVRARTATSRR